MVRFGGCSRFNILGWRAKSFWSVYNSLFWLVHFDEPL